MKLLGTLMDAVLVAHVEAHLQLVPVTQTVMCLETAAVMYTHLVNQVHLMLL